MNQLSEKEEFNNECLAASDLLRSWGLIDRRKPYPVQSLAPVILTYRRGRRYTFGACLYDHLRSASLHDNLYVSPGTGAPIEKLNEFLWRTSTLTAAPDILPREREIFNASAKTLKERSGISVVYDPSLSPQENRRCLSRATRMALGAQKKVN